MPAQCSGIVWFDMIVGFLSAFGDSRKSNTYAAHVRHIEEVERLRQAQSFPT